MTSNEQSTGKNDLILVVEDEEKLASVVIDYLHAAGFATHWSDCGADAIEAAREENPALILLDLNLPDIDGLTVCHEMRAFTNAPIVMVTARTEEIDRVLGLDAGADDYVCKPFSPNELLARIRAILRRIHWPDGEQLIAGLLMDERRHIASLDGQSLDLTPVEFRLLHTLINSPGRVFSRGQLLDHVYDDARDVTDRAIDSHIRNLRVKLRDAHEGEDLIRSVYGVGYKFEP